jgi:protein-disulfide isomerase
MAKLIFFFQVFYNTIERRDSGSMDNDSGATPKDPVEPEPFDEGLKYPWYVTLIVGAAMLLVGSFLGYLGRGQFGPEAQQANATLAAEGVALQTQAAQNQKLMDYLQANTRHWRGPEDAEVFIIEFSDYQWPYCGQFATDAGRLIDEQYVQTGKVRFGYWNFAFLGEESAWAAEAAECAADQGKFWEYHDILWVKLGQENKVAFSKDNLKTFATELGLDAGRFNECLDTGKHTQLIAQDTQLAQQIGVQSTPSFVVNGAPLVGAQPFEKFKSLIEQFLNQ